MKTASLISLIWFALGCVVAPLLYHYVPFPFVCSAAALFVAPVLVLILYGLGQRLARMSVSAFIGLTAVLMSSITIMVLSLSYKITLG